MNTQSLLDLCLRTALRAGQAAEAAGNLQRCLKAVSK